MDNQSYQSNWQKLINENVDGNELSSKLGISPDILDMYKSFVWNHYTGSLEKMFPRLSDVWNLSWDEISKMYYQKFPPMEWELNDLTLKFPEFLASVQDELSIPAFYSELAEYEVSEFMVYKDELEENESLDLNSSLKVHQFSHDIAGWVKQMDDWEEGGQSEKIAGSIPMPCGSVLFVAQNPETRLCVFTSASLVDIAIYEVLNQIEINPMHVVSELKAAIDQMLPIEVAKNITTSNIKQHLDFLKKQSVII